jgi:hypothetical protein
MEQSSKEMSKKQEGVSAENGMSSEPEGKERPLSQDDILKRCRVELSMEEYGRLARRALREGCTPEELVAREIEQLARG